MHLYSGQNTSVRMLNLCIGLHMEAQAQTHAWIKFLSISSPLQSARILSLTTWKQDTFHCGCGSPSQVLWCWLMSSLGQAELLRISFLMLGDEVKLPESLKKKTQNQTNKETNQKPYTDVLCITSLGLGVTYSTRIVAPPYSSIIFFFPSCIAPFCYSVTKSQARRGWGGGYDLQYTNPLKNHKWNTQLGRSSLMRWSVVRSGSSQHPPCRPEVIPSEQLLIIIIIWHFSSTSGAIFFFLTREQINCISTDIHKKGFDRRLNKVTLNRRSHWNSNVYILN